MDPMRNRGLLLNSALVIPILGATTKSESWLVFLGGFAAANNVSVIPFRPTPSTELPQFLGNLPCITGFDHFKQFFLADHWIGEVPTQGRHPFGPHTRQFAMVTHEPGFIRVELVHCIQVQTKLTGFILGHERLRTLDLSPIRDSPDCAPHPTYFHGYADSDCIASSTGENMNSIVLQFHPHLNRHIGCRTEVREHRVQSLTCEWIPLPPCAGIAFTSGGCMTHAIQFLREYWRPDPPSTIPPT